MNHKDFKEKIIPAGNKLYRFALRLLQNPDDAKDALQQVLLKLWEMRDSLENYRNIDAFAMTMIKNNCLDRLKTKKKNVGYEVLDVVPQYRENETPDTILFRNEKIGHIKQKIDALPHLQKMVIQLKDIEGLSFEEIAEILDIEINAIRVNLFRARKKIKEHMIKLQL